MFHVINKSCPYEDWASEANIHCNNPDNFHCVKDEYGRIGWVCAQPIWVEKDNCPVYNIGAEKLDTTSCHQTRCPPYNYRSNDINVEYACRYLYVRPTTISPSTFPNVSTGTNNNNNSTSPELWVIPTTLLTLLVVVGVIAAIVMLYTRCRKIPSQNDEVGLEEFKNLLQDKAKSDISNKAEEQSESLTQAMKFLDRNKIVVITGIQGSGKTFLAKSLVTYLNKNGGEMKSIWISNIELLKNQTKSIGEFDIYVFDGIFYELQMKEKFEETLKAFNKYLCSIKRPYLILTIPSYIWQKHTRWFEFEAKLGEVRVDLDKRSESEKRTVLTILMNRYDVPRGQAENICELQNDLLKEASNGIGFPALISYMCKQPNGTELKKLLKSPLKSMSKTVASLKKASLKERGKYLILAYMSLKDGKMDVDNMNKDLFNYLKKTYVPAFVDKDLAKYAKSMIGYYLLSNDENSFEFDSNILKKIVFVSVAKENALFVQMNCKNEYLKYTIPKELCPDDMDTIYAECFTRV